MSEYSILIGGKAGEGSRKAGFIIARILASLGFYIYIYEDYPSLIKGGHNFSQIRASFKKVLGLKNKKLDFLLALDDLTLKLHQKDLKKEGFVLANPEICPKKKGIPVPMDKIVKEEGGAYIMRNVALIGAFAKLIGVSWRKVEKILKEELKKETELNLKIAKRGYESVKTLAKIKKISQKEYPILTGNQAIALGAKKAGLEIYIAYPMTPSTSILHFLAQREDLSVLTFQPENEIAVITSALGASFAGKRTMVGTSGGGFALMTEALSLSAQSETPILIVESQRMAPSTGVPTYSAQSDLLFVLFAGHGDFVRFVTSPGDAEEAFFLAGLSLNIAWKYQLPSILLCDKQISESSFSFDKKIERKVKKEKPILWSGKEKYKRYKITKNGISPLAFPGEKGAVVKATSYEHDEFGLTVEDEESIKKMQEKRLRKYESLKKEVEEKIESVKIYGKKTSKTALLFWGSTKGPAIEAVEDLGIKAIQILVLEPFPKKQLEKALKNVKTVITAETSAMPQFANYLESQGVKVQNSILKYTGRPFFAEELKEKICKILK